MVINMKVRKTPQRKCIGCGEMKEKKELMRVLRETSGEISLDLTGKKNGRGAYLCKNGECLKKAIKGKGLERSFQMAIPASVYEALEKEFALSDTK